MTYVSGELRQLVIERAGNQCEYCHFPQNASLLAFEMEHIIAEKHEGLTKATNLALACPFCNRAKGTDLGSIDKVTGQLTLFFNSRTQLWQEHFQVVGAEIIPLTPEARVTVTILRFNHPDRLREREQLQRAGQSLE